MSQHFYAALMADIRCQSKSKSGRRIALLDVNEKTEPQGKYFVNTSRIHNHHQGWIIKFLVDVFLDVSRL